MFMSMNHRHEHIFLLCFGSFVEEDNLDTENEITKHAFQANY